jgi:hypothetical protein
MNDLHFAVVVGINPYPAIGNLTAAHSDAEDFYRWVTSAKGGKVPEANAVRLLGELPLCASGAEAEEKAEPTREAISDALETFKDRVSHEVAGDPTVWPQTRLYFFGAGHGIASERSDAALLAANARPGRYTRHVSCVSLLDFFERQQRFRELVFFADCCRTSVIGTVPRMPADLEGDDDDRGGVRKFLACGAIFNKRALEEIHLPLDQRRGYFSRALIVGLEIGPPKTGSPIKSNWLKEHITEHMRQASQTRFRTPLEPGFVDEGSYEVDFGTASAAPGENPVRIEVRSLGVTGLEIASSMPGGPRLKTVRSAVDRTIFECRLPVGLYEAIPLGVPAPPVDKAWTFKVIEGGVTHAF